MNMTNNNLFRELKVLGVALILAVILVILPSSDLSSGQPTGGQPTSSFQVLNITFSDDAPREGDDIIISTYIKNNSPLPIDNLTVSFILNNEVLKNITDISIGVNESKLVEYEWATEKGQQNIGVILYKDGNLIQTPMVNENIYVEQQPLGDIGTLVLAILVIFIFVLILVILPSILSALQPDIEPYAYRKDTKQR
jgi:hypothetical protein